MATINLHGHNYTVVPAHTKKANAYEYCRDREREFGSYNGVIASHNSMMFTYAFTGWCDCKKYLIYITRDRDYAIEIQ